MSIESTDVAGSGHVIISIIEREVSEHEFMGERKKNAQFNTY
jgi:hypothetical protein